MQRVIAETIQLVQFALVDGVLPVDVEHLLRHRSDTVHIIGIERNDTSAEKVGHIIKQGIFATLQRQFSGEALFRFDARLDSSDIDVVALQRLVQHPGHGLLHLLECRYGLLVLLKQPLAM